MKIKAKIAQMPIVTTSLDYMVQVTEPLELVPMIMTLEGEKTLETVILEDFKDMAKGTELENITEVELIECDLLTPKGDS